MKTRILPFFAIALLLISNLLHAQSIRNYSLIYSENLKGGHTLIGNTLMERDEHAMNVFSINPSNGTISSYGNDNTNMKMVNRINNSSTIINFGDNWKYHNVDSKPDNWPNVTTLSKSGNTPLYYSSYYSKNIDERNTHYFVKQVSITNPNAYPDYQLEIKYESGFIIYINGVEKARHNITGNNPSFNVDANYQDNGTKTFTLPASAFKAGTNTIQVEMKYGSSYEDDIYFNLKLEGKLSLRNASSADLSLPAGTNKIKYARLYWGGRVSTTDDINTDNNLKKAKIKFGNGNFGNITASSLDKKTEGNNTFYQSYADVTSFVNTNKSGTYTVGDVTATEGAFSTGGAYAGWSLVVVYENETLPYHSVRLYDGFIEVYNDGNAATQTVTLNNLDVPGNALNKADAWMSTMAWEGDGNLGSDSRNTAGDFLKINGNFYSDAVNHVKNIWNGTISKNENHVTTKYPNYKNQMGIDIDEFEIGKGYGIQPNDKKMTITFGTEDDQYFPSIAAFSIRMKDPVISIDKTVQDVNNGMLNINDELLYTLSGQNTGEGMAYNVVITDELPQGIEYVPNTIEEWNGSKWIAAKNATYNSITRIGTCNIGIDATPTSGGKLVASASYKIRFKVKVIARGVIINIASVTGDNGAGARFTDEGTAIIGFDEIPLSIKLGSFKAENTGSSVQLNWQTLTEINNDRFEVERSTDGIQFAKIGTVKGSGSTTIARNYQFTDAATGITAKVVYYRLRDVDTYGKATLSKIVSVRLDKMFADNNFTAYPNPFVSDIRFNINSKKGGDINIRILNQSGLMVTNANTPVQPGSNLIVVKDLQVLKPGIYILQVKNDNEVITQKIMKR